MLYPVLVAKEPTDAIPRGAAILEHGRRLSTRARENQRAVRRALRASRPPRPAYAAARRMHRGRPLRIDPRRNTPAARVLARWLGHPVSRGDLEARENRTTRRHRARQLFYQGRYADAQRIDPRMGF